jgi:hypothetical protein
VYDAKQATRMDKATRYGSYVPVTTIGIAPIFGPKAPRQHSATSLLQSGIAGHRLFVYPNYGTVREVSEPPSTTRLHPSMVVTSSITSSARMTGVGGTSRPSALAAEVKQLYNAADDVGGGSAFACWKCATTS